MWLSQKISAFALLLKQPYPPSTDIKEKVILAISSGFFVAVFLIIFQPFGIDSVPVSSRFPVAMGYGIITMGCMLFNNLILQRLLADYFAEDRWTILKQMGWFMFQILIIAIINTLYSYLLDLIQLDLRGFLFFLMITFAVGVFPVAGITLTHYVRLLKKHTAKANALHLSQAPAQEHQTQVIHLIAENEKDYFSLPVHKLLFIQSSDNYSTILFDEGHKINKELIRSSLVRLESQISFPFIQRCHRSYIANLSRVQNVTGNAQGYQLHYGASTAAVPVSRKYAKVVLDELQQFTDV